MCRFGFGQSEGFFVLFDQEAKHHIEFSEFLVLAVFFGFVAGPDQSAGHFGCNYQLFVQAHSPKLVQGFHSLGYTQFLVFFDPSSQR